MVEVILSDSTFENEVLKAQGLVLVDFFATWCGPCIMLAPVISELAEEYKGKAKICKLDVDANHETAEKYGVMSIPTLIFFKNGEVIEQIVGAHSKDALKEKIEELL